MSLCPMSDQCPEVEVAGDEVRIGEAGSLVTLKKDEWNVLVDPIQSGSCRRSETWRRAGQYASAANAP